MQTRISLVKTFPQLKAHIQSSKPFWLPSLIVLFIVLRLLPIWGGNFAFQYDNAKDSLLMLDMWVNKDPVLTGPTTSIPGLFYGPAWYYLALPLNVLMNFHPIAGILTVWLFGLLNVYLLFKYVNPLSALLYTVSVGVIGAQLNAWTPYMTILLMVPLLILWLQIAKEKHAKTWQLVALASCTGLLFHTQVAYAIVFLPICLYLVFTFRSKFSVKQLLLASATFSLFLLPSLLFELTHDWLQTRSVITFIQNYAEESKVVQPNEKGLGRVLEVGMYISRNASQAVVPYGFGDAVGFAVIGLVGFWLHKSGKPYEQKVIGAIVFGTFLLYLVLPVKEYYLVALTPVWIYGIAQLLTNKKNQPLIALTVCVVLLSFVQLQQTIDRHQRLAETNTLFFSTKQQAIEKVYELTEGKPFSSYQFTPEVYDYTYQHLFLRQQLLGKPLPVEFSYAPGESSYIPYKTVPENTQSPEFVTLIVEPYFSKEVYDAWWTNITNNVEIIEQHRINDSFSVYKAVKKVSDDKK